MSVNSDDRTIADIIALGEAVRKDALRRTLWVPILATATFVALTVIAAIGNDVDASTRAFTISSTGTIALMFWGLHSYAADLTATEAKLNDALSYLTDEPEDDELEA